MRQFWFNVFLHFAAPITFLVFLLFLYSLLPFVREKWKEKKYWFDLALSFLGAVTIFLSMEVGFKVLSDETNLLSVANMISQFGMASNTEQWIYYYHTYHPLDFSVPSRPIFFPVLTAIVHFFNGMQWWSPFVVNFFAFWGLGFLSLQLVPRDRIFPWLAILSLLMSPVLLIVSTSGGFDLLSLFFAVCVFTFWKKWIREEKEEYLLALLASIFCFSSVRYESIVLLPLFLALHPRAIGQFGWKWIPCLLFLVPLVIQRVLTWGTFENPAGVPAFSFRHLVDHLPDFGKSFFWNTKGPYPVVLHWLGIVGLFLILKDGKKYLFPLVYSLFLLVLLLSHHFGFAGHPTQVRLFLPLSFALVFLGLIPLRRWKMASPIFLVAYALLTFHHASYAISDPLTTQLTMTREVRHIRDFLKQSHPNDLYVYDRPGQLSALGFSAISWHHFQQNREKYLEDVSRGLYQNLYFIDRPTYGTVRPPVEHLKSLTVREHQLSPEEKLRISKFDSSYP